MVTAGDGRDDGRLLLWWTPLDLSATALREAGECLTTEELRRAERYAQAKDRDRFVAARAGLRRVLARQLGCPPAQVRIEVAEGGKPHLAGSDLRFNASRSGDKALYATSWTTEVGVDLERIRPDVDVDGLARRFFTEKERRALASRTGEERLVAAFECWTRKEAYVKGVGAGLRLPLKELDVWSGRDEPTTVGGWLIHQVQVSAAFAAAVAGESLADWVPAALRAA